MHNELFRFSIDNALEIMIIFDTEGKIVYANQSAKEQLEYGEDLCTNSITDIFPGEFQSEDGSFMLEDNMNDWLGDMMAYRKNRTCFPAKVKLMVFDEPFKGDEAFSLKKNRLYICQIHNATTQNLLEKRAGQADLEAEEAQKVKTEFVANVTHELRTPVNGILGNTKQLLELETDKEKLKLLGLVERGCKDMNAIINNILDFSKLEAGKFILEPQEFNFRNMIEYVKGNHSNRIIEKGLEFSVAVSPDIPETVIGDELRIVQVLNNLISNAYKFTSVGRIHVEVVRTAHSGNRIELFFMVMDTGIGIAKKDQDKLFKSFSQVDASISRKYGGTGLGLNICKQLVELMDGHIHVNSDEGKGTNFSFNVWVDLPEIVRTVSGQYERSEYVTDGEEKNILKKLQSVMPATDVEKVWRYGEPENKAELDKKLSKLILCVEMENWEKAEGFADTVKQLLEEAPREIKSAALRLKMAVQKADYDKAVTAYDTLQELLA